MQNLIQRVRLALSVGVDIQGIYETFCKDYSNEDIFLAIKAAQILDS